MISRIREHPGLAWGVGAGILALAYGQLYLNYDSFYALVWGRDLAGLDRPDYDLLLAPTPHPLLTLFGAALTPFGDLAPGLMSAAIAISWAGLIAAVYLLGSSLFWPSAGAIAAVVVATREPLSSWAVRGYVDIPFLALVAAAAALEARRTRAGIPVLVLLGLAGLLRPEAWALAGLYWLWLWPNLDARQRAWTAALAAAAPAGWLLYDLITAGNPFQSFTGTRENVEVLGRRTGLDDVPYTFTRWLGYLLREPGIVGALGIAATGFVAARRGNLPQLVNALGNRARLPAAVFAAGAAVFAVYGLAGLPLISRYLTIPALILAVFCGAALTGWKVLQPGALRSRWRALALATAVVLLALFPFQVNRLVGLHERSSFRQQIQADLRSLTTDPRARAAFLRCDRIYLPNHRPVPILAWWLDRPPAELLSAQVHKPRRGAFVAPANERVEEAFTLDRRDPKRLDAEVPPGFRRVTGNRSWTLHEDC